jgi:hypothetical protein
MPPMMEERRRNQHWRHIEKGVSLSTFNYDIFIYLCNESMVLPE